MFLGHAEGGEIKRGKEGKEEEEKKEDFYCRRRSDNLPSSCLSPLGCQSAAAAVAAAQCCNSDTWWQRRSLLETPPKAFFHTDAAAAAHLGHVPVSFICRQSLCQRVDTNEMHSVYIKNDFSFFTWEFFYKKFDLMF